MRVISTGVLRYIISASVVGIGVYVYYIVLNYVFHQMFSSSLFPSDSISENILIALIGGLASGLLVYAYSKNIDESENVHQHGNTEIRSTGIDELSQHQNPDIDDIDNFCRSVIAWKVSASKKDEMFTLFKDHPYYLIGYLTYITQRNIEETKILQKRLVKLTMMMAIIAVGTMGYAMYAINPVFFVPGVILAIMLVVAIWYVPKKVEGYF
jgi:hypothetical protein